AGSAEIIERIFSQVDPRLLTNLRLTHEQVEKVILDSRIRAVTLTGSERAGKSVAEVAGRVLKKTVLELGGSDAYLVLADADIEQAAMSCARARMENNGQSCIAAKRFVVEESVLESFLESFSRAIIEMKRGDPALPATRLGPLASGKFRKSLLQQCENLEKLGAKKIFEAESFPEFSLNHPGAFFPARIYRADPEIQAHFQEELFGPVALVFAFKTMPEALGIANNTPYGLGGAIFSEDLDRAEQWAKNLDCGMVAINSQLKSDARRPFGGVKNSGYGRELGLYGFNEFCNIKSLVLS
ncbi:MAG: succinate-semialdehyde dehydrogenase, partial [Bdellovibrio sp. CG10_big_fil_rev_8_21_14_0_10_47_8]